jgi:hypothetical protein
MNHFEKKIFTPYLALNQLIDKLAIEFSARRRIFCTHCFLQYHSFWFKIMILLRHFHIVTIDGGYCTVQYRRIMGSVAEPLNFCAVLAPAPGIKQYAASIGEK